MDLLADRMQRLVDGHAVGLTLYARSLGASPELAEDVVAEAVAGLWKQLAAGREIAAPLGYLVQSVRHGTGRRMKQLARRREIESARPAPWFAPGTEGSLDTWAQDALARLPESQREIVVLKIWSGLTFQQIADALEIPISTAGHRYRTALARLREMEDNPHA